MKKTIAILALLLSSSVYAVTAGNPTVVICQNLPYSSDKLSCLQIVKDHFFEEDIVTLCNAQPFPNEKLECLKQAADTVYDPDQLKVCIGMPYATEVIDCLKLIGTPYASNPYPNAEYVRARLTAASAAVDRSNQGEAQQILGELLKYFEGH